MSRPSLPTHVGPYHVTEYRGEGPLGHTVLAEHGEGGYRVVARLLPIEPGRESVIASPHFGETATIIGALSHMGLADVLEVARAGSFVCVIEEAVPGMSLAQWLSERGALSVGEARQVIAQVFLAVDFAHQRHFPHGSVKPSNIHLMDRHLSVKVVDAGLPELLRQVAPERYARLVESPYAAPELRGGGQASVSSDMYALAVTFHEMLTGAPPARLAQPRQGTGATRFELLELGTVADGGVEDEAEAQRASLRGLVDLPEEQIHAIEQAMSETPEQRPPTIRAMRVAFGFVRPTSPEARQAAAGLMGALAAEVARQVEYSLPAGGSGEPCPACRRPLRPGAASCLACGYVLPRGGGMTFQPVHEDAAETTARADHLEIGDPRAEGAPTDPSAGTGPGTQPEASSVPPHADPLAEAEPCIRTGDARVDFYVTQGDRLIAAGRHEEALQAYRSGAGDTPSAALAHHRAGDVLAMLRRYRDAQRHYERAIALNPADCEARHDLGRVLLTRGELRAAVDHLSAIVEANPSPELRLSALTHLGSAYCAQGLMDQAVAAWSRVVREGPPNAPVRYSLGVACARLGDHEAAKAHWRAALADDPNHAESRAALTQADSEYGRDFLGLQRVPDGPGRGASLLTGALDILGSLLGPRRYW